jgi:hypothetical protein
MDISTASGRKKKKKKKKKRKGGMNQSIMSDASMGLNL